MAVAAVKDPNSAARTTETPGVSPIAAKVRFGLWKTARSRPRSRRQFFTALLVRGDPRPAAPGGPGVEIDPVPSVELSKGTGFTISSLVVVASLHDLNRVIPDQVHHSVLPVQPTRP